MAIFVTTHHILVNSYNKKTKVNEEIGVSGINNNRFSCTCVFLLNIYGITFVFLISLQLLNFAIKALLNSLRNILNDTIFSPIDAF